MTVYSLIRFTTCDNNLFGVGDNDVIAKVFRLVIDGFVFAHKESGDVDCKRSKDTIFGRDGVPCSGKCER